MWMNALSTHMYLYHVFAWYWGGQRRVLDLEFQVVLSCHVYAMNQTWVFYKNSKCSYQVSHLSSPVLDFLNTGDLIPQTWTDYSTQTWISFFLYILEKALLNPAGTWCSLSLPDHAGSKLPASLMITKNVSSHCKISPGGTKLPKTENHQ